MRPRSIPASDAQRSQAQNRLLPAQAPLATEKELGRTHDPAYVRRFLAGEVTDTEMRSIGLPWTPELATYCRRVAARCWLRSMPQAPRHRRIVALLRRNDHESAHTQPAAQQQCDCSLIRHDSCEVPVPACEACDKI